MKQTKTIYVFDGEIYDRDWPPESAYDECDRLSRMTNPSDDPLSLPQDADHDCTDRTDE